MPPAKPAGRHIAVVGSGPAGLSAAFYVLRLGHKCTIFDSHSSPGGALRYEISDEKLPKTVLDCEIDSIRQMGAVFIMNTTVDEKMLQKKLRPGFDAVILATGSDADQIVSDFGLNIVEQVAQTYHNPVHSPAPGVFVCDNRNRKRPMGILSLAHGKMAARTASHYLETGNLMEVKHPFHSSFGHLLEEEFEEYMKEGIKEKRVEPKNGFMGGFTQEEAILEARRCMHCDCRKPQTCKLRQYAGEYGAKQKHRIPSDQKRITRSVQHDFVVYEPQKCIRCGLCIEITERGGESAGLSYIGRGFNVTIGIPFDLSLKEALTKTAAACVAACPTGALAWKKNSH